MLVSNCSNNYGPYQFPEKLIPLIVLNALAGEPLPVYGAGREHPRLAACRRPCSRVAADRRRGPGRRDLSDRRREPKPATSTWSTPSAGCSTSRRPDGAPHARLIAFVTDRPGHDARYAIDPSKIERELGWRPRYDLDRGLAATIDWYIANQEWCRRASASYRRAAARHPGGGA